MRVRIVFEFKGELKLPIWYNNLIQAMIYSNISDQEKRDKLHEFGYLVGPKKIKLMTFSKLFGKYRIENKSIIFNSPVYFIFSSYDDDLVSDIAYNFLSNQKLYLNGTKIIVKDLIPSFFDYNIYKNRKHYIIEMLSPITVYTTLKNKKKIFFEPWSNDFENAVRKNIATKLKAINKYSDDFTFNISYNNMKNQKDEKIIYFKDTLIKAYNGIYTIRTEPEIMKLLFYSGIGSKNSEGFGCFKILGDKN
ncbi:CRISPR-associated endoribonuclease Cas6 [Picrophilus oshimae]|uniref:CRISPR-associated endoribonuclease n=1 Tax=Picrophilus torridus (strain ATCC 700027 / DSM 9790 / JCM 10055 / NBRC 100828 / KAW 2/3) TaxID=1122961 RepID=A0A8G2FXT4_PICTO|nr:CRISPR-associated endoribonuclease Cas6 [Picrophilus oshimae]SMD31398.1 CRISPR-associated endoribonuclease Cas6 [Picrophilus oshimae DSM 9789]